MPMAPHLKIYHYSPLRPCRGWKKKTARFHGLRGRRLRRHAAPPVATALRPEGADEEQGSYKCIDAEPIG